MSTIRRRPEVVRDLMGLADYIARDSLDAALRFLDAAEATFQFVADNPEIGNVYFQGDPELGDIRYWRVKRFPKHIIFYRAMTGGIEVVRVLHGARDIEGVFRQNGP